MVSAWLLTVNVAVAESAWSTLTVQVVAAPVHAPDQPVKSEVASAAAVRVTLVPAVNAVAHVEPQLIPAGEDVTVPEPEPARTTVTGKLAFWNVAVTLAAASIVTRHVPVPLHAPDQPVNADSASAVASSATTVPEANEKAHVLPQEMPEGEDVTAPAPGPAFVTVSAWELRVNVAPTVFAASVVTVQLDVPAQAPVHPANVQPVAGVAVSVTLAPEA
jgi:hypothetical protein